MTLNNKHDVEQMQRLQNRALRLCYNINNPRDITVARLHEMANVEILQKRMMLQLMTIMYENSLQAMYERAAIRNTRRTDKYTFETNRVNLTIYSQSPYYIGSKTWNDLPKNVQESSTKDVYKRALLNLI